jgi:hypothetical protein
MMELNKALNASSTTLNNSINAFNQLNFNKFVENVVEEIDEENQGSTPDPFGNPMDQTSFLGDLKSEDEKLTNAL